MPYPDRHGWIRSEPRMVIDPADVDWTEQDDLEVTLSARAGIPEAAAEAKRRGLEEGTQAAKNPEPTARG
jgi:hypothetical protein